MEAEPVSETCANSPDDKADSPIEAPELDVANAFTRLARFSPHTRRWHSIDRAPSGRGDGAGDDTPGGER